MAVASDSSQMFETSTTMLQQALDGVKAYQDSDVTPFHREMECVFEINRTRVLKPQGWTGDKQILLVPSIINSWRIFDIEDEHSFLAYLHDNNYCPLVIEWAPPITNITLENYITDHLKPICDAMDIDAMIGYCMGGTMITALYALFSDLKIDKTVLIAPPWNFDYQTPDQHMRIQSLALQTHMMGVAAPRDYIQSLFWAVDPLQVFKKFQKFPNVDKPERFVRVEDWLNEGIEVSTSAIQTCLFDWYRDNKLANGQWMVGGHAINDKNLPKQTLVIAGGKDHLVPMASVKPLTAGRQLITVNTGHIGLMASDKSIENAWQPIVKFLNK